MLSHRQISSYQRLFSAIIVSLSLWSAPTTAAQSVVENPQTIGFSMVKTASAGLTPEAVLVDSGSWFTLRRLAQNAVLIRHPQGDVLIDSGLGSNIEQQFSVNSFMNRQLFAYTDLDPAIEQFKRAGYPSADVVKIIPTHLHWDHASGLEDFPTAQIWVQQQELEEAREGAAPAHLQNQIDGEQLQWHFLQLNNQAYMGFDNSLDLYGDGSIVLVDLSGHSAGQIGIFLTISSGKQYFFSGDTSWTTKGIDDSAPRSSLIKWLVHLNWSDEKNEMQISKLHQLQNAHPDLTIVPAHDEIILQDLPLFPQVSY